MYISTYLYIYNTHVYIYIYNTLLFSLLRPFATSPRCHTPSSHSKNSLPKICSKGWVAQAPFLLIGNNTSIHYLR